MTIQIEIGGTDPQPLADALAAAGIEFSLTSRKGYDGMAVATLVVNAVAALGAIATPIILHLLPKKRSDDIELTIEGISVRGLSQERIKQIVDDLVREQGAADEGNGADGGG